MRLIRLLLLVLLAGLVAPASLLAVDFEDVTIDPHPGKVGYAVTTADVNGDDRPDVVVVTEDRVLWYEAPDWNVHEMLNGGTKTDNVCIAAHDIDGDGKVDFALGAGWPRNGGTIHWIARNEQRGVTGLWDLYDIGAEPWTHRMRFGNVLGKEQPQLVVSALNGNEEHAARLIAFEIPADPRRDRWTRTILTADVQRMHNHWCLPAEAVLPQRTLSHDATLTATQEGISIVAPPSSAADEWERTVIAHGAEGDDPGARGAGEIKVGKLANGQSILATIEPMHGNAAVVYVFEGAIGQGKSQRHVLDDSLAQGHAVWCADFDQDGSDEIVIGHREPGQGEVKGPGVYLFDHDGTQWRKQVIDDGGMACEDLAVADLNGDGLLDIVAAGRATHNVKIYFQKAK